jgi:hypothetical protein
MIACFRVILISLLVSTVALAQNATISASGSMLKQYSTQTQTWQPISQPSILVAGDTLTADSNGVGTLNIGTSTTLLLKGSTRIGILQSSSNAVTLSLLSGQILLKRVTPHDSIATVIVSGGCAFSPKGTKAAIRYLKTSEVSVAVIEGAMQLESPRGEMILVPAGSFASFDPMVAGLKQGALSEKAITALTEWAEPAVITQSQQTTPSSAPVSAPTQAPVSQPPLAVETKPAPIAPQAVPPAPAPSMPPKQLEKTSAIASDASKSDKPSQTSISQTNKPNTPEPKKPESSQKPADAGKEKPTYEFGVSSVTVDNEQWTRIAFGVDIPLWKFGVFVDAELFINGEGKFSDKGWRFDKDNWQEGVFRKIRYIRFGHEQEPLFIKFGGLSNVTLGYGFVVDRFTNMLHYPDKKLPGLQVYLNDLSPIGLTLQTMIADVGEFKDKGGIVAGRIAFVPLKATSAPLLNKLSIGATYATDLNQFTAAKKWHYAGNLRDKNTNNLTDWDFALRSTDSATIRNLSNKILDPDTAAIFDSIGTPYSKIDTTYRDSVDSYGVIGFDAGIPLIKAEKIGLDIYGQMGLSYDSDTRDTGLAGGWGFGAPGVALRVGPIMASVEYRHIVGRFMPGYFGTYYYDERVTRYPSPVTKSQNLDSVNLNGIFGSLSVNIANVVNLYGAYQYLIGDNDMLDHRAEANLGISDKLLEKVPKIRKVEGYFSKTNIWRNLDPISGERDKVFDPTPSMYYGYRLGFELTPGAMLIWDSRYGYKYNSSNKLVSNNNVSIQTVITF